ncbi:sulfite exporter TauE/SafE family protein [Flavobacteriaceae bacterium MHTCC 0001]
MLWSAFIFGILGSFHCVGMCGPIAFMLPVDRTNTVKKISQIAIYHLGRLLAYCLIGLAFGLVGKSLYIFGFQQELSATIGTLMIVSVIIPRYIFRRYNILKPVYKIISKIKNALGSALKRKSMDTFLTIGFLNGFLPCGLVYMAIFAAITLGNATDASLYMATFGLGTIPLMTTAIYLSNVLKGKFRQHIQNVIPVVIIIIGTLFIIRGLGLGIPYLSPTPINELVANNIDCH